MTTPIDFGDKQFDYGAGYPTPFSIPDETACRTFRIPASDDDGSWLALFMGLVLTLTVPENWVQFEGAIERDDAAARWVQMMNDAYKLADDLICSTDVETPYWDEDSDVDLSEDVDSQPWYGIVEDVFAPPDGMTFRENVELWSWSGLVALAATPAAAVLFHTVAARFIVAFKAGDVGEVIRVIIDSADGGMVDTSGHAGEVMQMNVYGDPSLDTHDLLIVKVS